MTTHIASRCKATIEFGKSVIRCYRDELHVKDCHDGKPSPRWETGGGIRIPVHSGLANDGTTVIWPDSVLVFKSKTSKDGKPIGPGDGNIYTSVKCKVP